MKNLYIVKKGLSFFRNFVYFPPAQYWKVSRTSNLVNKSGKWQFSSLKWTLPEEECKGPITDKASGKVLGIIDQDSLVELVLNDDGLLSSEQTWVRAKQNKEGWFMLINSSSNKALTALSATTTAITGFFSINHTSLNFPHFLIIVHQQIVVKVT